MHSALREFPILGIHCFNVHASLRSPRGYVNELVRISTRNSFWGTNEAANSKQKNKDLVHSEQRILGKR